MSLLRTTRGGKTVDFAVGNGGVILGTAPGCQIVVSDPSVAPKHAKVVKSPQGYVVSDLSGGGATLVNGTKVKEQVLKIGDVIQVGAEKFVFAEPAPASAPKAAAPASPPANAGGRRPLPSRPPQTSPPTRNRPAPALKSSGASPSGPARATATAAPPHKLTAKPGSVARVHKDKATFTLPATSKGRMIAISVGVGLVVVGGILFYASTQQVNSEDVKKKAIAAIKEMEAIPEADFMKRFSKADEIASNADYDKYAKGEIQSAVRVRNELQSLVQLQARASKEVPAFLANYQKQKEGPADDFKKEWMSLYDTASVHLSNYERTTFGPELKKICNELKTHLENVGPTWSEFLPGLLREVHKLVQAGNFTKALLLINEFGVQHGENDSTQLKGKLQDERAGLKTAAKIHVDKAKERAAKMTTKEEGRKLLEALKPFVMGFPEIEKLVDRYALEFK